MRGRRVDIHGKEEKEPEIFGMGRDADYEGFLVALEDEEGLQEGGVGGRHITLNELLNVGVEEDRGLFDRDVGESSEEEL